MISNRAISMGVLAAFVNYAAPFTIVVVVTVVIAWSTPGNSGELHDTTGTLSCINTSAASS